MSIIHISAELESQIRAYMQKSASTVTFEQFCEQCIVRGLAESASHSSYATPSEDEVQARLRSLGYID